MTAATNINVRAARALVETVTATRDAEQRSVTAMTALIADAERALHRTAAARRFVPRAVLLTITAAIAVTGIAFVHDGLLTVSVPMLLGMAVALFGAPHAASTTATRLLDARARNLSGIVSDLRARQQTLRAGIGALNITVAESVDILRQMEGTAA